MNRYGRRRHAAAFLAAAMLPAIGAADSSGAGNTPPQGPGHIGFAADFPVLSDHEWKFQIGGFGGTHRHEAPNHIPVILVHGNNVDACDWYPVRDDFRAAGWSDQSLWALSYNGLGANNGTALQRTNQACLDEHQAMGQDGASRVTSNDINVPDLYDFILAVREYTGSQQFSIVSHSLGVTLARKTLKLHPDLRKDLVAFVGIAGGNHGTSFCPPGSEGQLNSCDEIAAGTPWLADLNGADGADEIYPPARWLTVYDGSGAGDPAYAGSYAKSPQLKGADNREYPGTYHNDLRIDASIVADYRKFLEDSESKIGAAGTPRATGGSLDSGLLAGLGLLALLGRGRRRYRPAQV